MRIKICHKALLMGKNIFHCNDRFCNCDSRNPQEQKAVKFIEIDIPDSKI